MLKKFKKAIIDWGKIIYEQKLAVATEGNISAKLGDKKIIITAANSHLGFLDYSHLLTVDYEGKIIEGRRKVSSELKLHLAIHKDYPHKVIIHAHPLFTNLFFAKDSCLQHLTFESSFFLKNLPVLEQDSVNVSDLNSVLSALGRKEIVVLKNHGVVAINNDFQGALAAIELLERQAQINVFNKLIS
jgi:L-fuculose-phosphate aldolase